MAFFGQRREIFEQIEWQMDELKGGVISPFINTSHAHSSFIDPLKSEYVLLSGVRAYHWSFSTSHACTAIAP